MIPKERKKGLQISKPNGKQAIERDMRVSLPSMHPCPRLCVLRLRKADGNTQKDRIYLARNWAAQHMSTTPKLSKKTHLMMAHPMHCQPSLFNRHNLKYHFNRIILKLLCCLSTMYLRTTGESESDLRFKFHRLHHRPRQIAVRTLCMYKVTPRPEA